MKSSLLRFILLAFSFGLVACTANNADLSSESVELNTSSQTSGQGNVDDDIFPRPEDILQEAGVALTISDMKDVLTDEGADKELRYWSAVALGRTGDPQALPILEEALYFEDADLRYGAVVGLGAMKDEDSVPVLETALYDEDSGVRSVAVSSIGMTGGHQASEALSAKLLDYEEPVAGIRMNAAFELGRFQDASAGPALSAVLNDGSIEVRTAAAVALADLNDDAGMETLVDSAMSPFTEEWLRIDAIDAIEELSGKSFNYTKPYSEPSTDEEKQAALRTLDSWWQVNEARYSEQ